MLVNDFSLIESGFALITAQLLSASVYELLGTKQLFAVIVISSPLIVYHYLISVAKLVIFKPCSLLHFPFS